MNRWNYRSLTTIFLLAFFIFDCMPVDLQLCHSISIDYKNGLTARFRMNDLKLVVEGPDLVLTSNDHVYYFNISDLKGWSNSKDILPADESSDPDDDTNVGVKNHKEDQLLIFFNNGKLCTSGGTPDTPITVVDLNGVILAKDRIGSDGQSETDLHLGTGTGHHILIAKIGEISFKIINK